MDLSPLLPTAAHALPPSTPQLFCDPNPNDPLNHEAAALYRDDKATFDRNVASSLRGGKIGVTTFPKLL